MMLPSGCRVAWMLFPFLGQVSKVRAICIIISREFADVENQGGRPVQPSENPQIGKEQLGKQHLSKIHYRKSHRQLSLMYALFSPGRYKGTSTVSALTLEKRIMPPTQSLTILLLFLS